MKSTATRWSVYKAATEFGVSRELLTKRLAAQSIIPKNGTYSTAEVCQALFGDYEGEKTRLTKAQADLAELKREEAERKLLPIAVMDSIMTQVLVAFREGVVAAPIDHALKENLLGILTGPKIDDIIAAASKDGEVADSGEEKQPC